MEMGVPIRVLVVLLWILGGVMKRYMLLHFGFERPTAEIMTAWREWWDSIADRNVDGGGFCAAREISKSGTRALPMDMEAITSFNIITAKDMDEAEKLAASNPFIASIRIYELREMPSRP